MNWKNFTCSSKNGSPLKSLLRVLLILERNPCFGSEGGCETLIFRELNQFRTNRDIYISATFPIFQATDGRLHICVLVEPLVIIWVVVSKIFGIFTPKLGEDEPNLTSILFNDCDPLWLVIFISSFP